MRDIIKTIKNIITQPTKFFKSIIKEKNIKDALTLYIIFLGISLVFSVIQNVISENLLAIPVAFTTMAFSLGFFFLGVLIIHGFFKLMQGKGKFKDSFNLMVYAGIPGLLINIAVGLLMTIRLLFEKETIVFSIWIFVGLLIAISIIWNWTLLVIGGSILHKISKGKAALAGIVLPLAVFLIIAIFIFLLIFMIIGAEIFSALA